MPKHKPDGSLYKLVGVSKRALRLLDVDRVSSDDTSDQENCSDHNSSHNVVILHHCVELFHAQKF